MTTSLNLSDNAFLSVYRDRCRHKAYRGGNSEGKVGAKKVVRMTWALADGLEAQERMHLLNSQCVAIFQDVRKSVLMVRYAATTDKLVMGRGVLGAVQVGTTSCAVRDGTEAALKQFCTPCLEPPSGGRTGAMLDATLFQHIAKHVEVVATDAASDELLAGRMLVESLFPHIKLLLKDKTHASRRPAAVNPKTREVVWGGGSLDVSRKECGVGDQTVAMSERVRVWKTGC
jgi:hypothetical protein